MIPYKLNRPMNVPQTLEVRLGILNAIHELMAEPLIGFPVQKFDPNQPRVPAGNRDGGQWASDRNSDNNSADVQRILATAKQLAASRASMNRCIDLCYPLLERFQPPGSNMNEFDFRRCLNQCLGLGR